MRESPVCGAQCCVASWAAGSERCLTVGCGLLVVGATAAAMGYREAAAVLGRILLAWSFLVSQVPGLRAVAMCTSEFLLVTEVLIQVVLVLDKYSTSSPH